MHDIAIFLKDITKRFGNNVAVNRVSLEVKRGEIFGLVGPDGAGKTTVMRILASIMDASGGYGEVLGYPLTTESEAIKESISYMSQKFGLYPDLTVEENINFYADIHNVSLEERKETQERLLEYSNLKPFRNRLAGNLSGGMKQKLGLTCALIHSPTLVLLDEPTNGVDPVSRRDFWNILKELQSHNITIFLTTSYLDEAEKCDRVALMHEGKILAIGTIENLRQLLPGKMLEISVPQPRFYFPLFVELFGENKIRLFGTRMHLITNDLENAQFKIKQLAQDNKIEPIEIKEAEPSLEDIFISVL